MVSADVEHLPSWSVQDVTERQEDRPLASASPARTGLRPARARHTIVIFIVLAALLPGLTTLMATGFASVYGECRWEPHPDPVLCNAG